MFKKLLFTFAFLAIAVAAAKTYTVTLYEPSVVAGKELKAGDYKLEVQGAKAVLSNGKDTVEANVKVEDATSKFGSTTVRYTAGSGKYSVQEIRLGGTKTRLVFSN